MAKYCTEKFENTTTGAEILVYWRQDKHVHNAAMITSIKQWLGQNHGGTWDVRANSFQSNQNEPTSGEEFSGG